MSTSQVTRQQQGSNGVAQVNLQSMLSSEKMKARLNEVLGESARGFAASILALSNTNPEIKQCDPNTVINACMKAAIFRLETDPSLSQAHIIPYNMKQPDGSFKKVAQFQLGYKGIKQLCIRSGWFKQMNVKPIYAGQYLSADPLRGIYEFDFSVEESGDPIGYAAYFQLSNGFEKTLYMNVGQIISHAKKYSKSYGKGFGPWKDNFPAMAMKTVMKLLLNSGEAPLSVEFRDAYQADQKVIVDPKNNEYDDVDHEVVTSAEIETKPADTETPPPTENGQLGFDPSKM